MTTDKETVVVSGSNGSGAGWFIAGIAIVALLVAGFLAYNGYFTGGDTATIELNLPDAPAVPTPAPSN